MNDEYQTRADIEKLYDLIYARTTESPVVQKREFDNFKDEVEDNYASIESLLELSNQLSELSNTTDDAIASLDESKADKTSWSTVYNENGVKLENNGINCRLTINLPNHSVTTSWDTIADLSDYTNYLPPLSFSTIGLWSVTYHYLHSSHIIRIAGTSSQTLDLYQILEWTI